MGNNSDPITLHKYLYANADPASVTDPSGQFGLVEFGVANNIRMELSNLQVDTGWNLINSRLDSDEPTAGSFGWGIIASLTPGIVKPFSKSIISKFFGRGKVA
jgi:hypothetical protein